jgi:hypothetical protein
MPQVKKIFVDSSLRSSGTGSDFTFELQESIYFEEPNVSVLVDDIAIPHTFRTVETGLNDKLYISEIESSGGETTRNSRILTLVSKNYSGPTLATELQNKLNAGSNFANEGFSAVYDVTTGQVTISLNTSSTNRWFRIFTDTELAIEQADWNSAVPYDKGNPMSINSVLRHEGTSFAYNKVAAGFLGAFTSGFLDLQGIAHNIYIHCDIGDLRSSIGPRGESTILKKVPIQADYGYLILDFVRSQYDFVRLGRNLLKTMRFSLRNSRGSVIPLHGSTCSFSLVFSYDQQ